MYNKIAHLKNISYRKRYFWQLVANFANFRQCNRIFMGGKIVHLKNINLEESLYINN